MTDKLTFADLGLKPVKSVDVVTWTAGQYVEPERDGQPWCTWEDAEDMLVQAVKSAMTGPAGLKATVYTVTRNDEASILALDVG